MTSLLNPTHPDVAPGIDPYAQAAPAPGPVAAERARWPIFGAVGAVSALAASFMSFPALEEEDYTKGPEVIDKLEAGQYRIAFLLGLVAFGCLLVAVGGWRRWAEARAPRDLAARTIGQGLAVTATVNVIFYGIVGSMGLYLPGGVEAETGMGRDGLFVNHVLLDFGTLLGWWGAAVAAIATAVLAFRKGNLLPRWMGVVSVVLLVLPIGMAVGTSLPGLVGFFMPIWLLVISIGMVLSRKAEAAA